MSDTSGEHSSSDEAADGCSLASPDGDSVNEADEYKPTKLQAIRKRSVDPKPGPQSRNPRTLAPKSSPKNEQKELKSQESITSDRKFSTGARFTRLNHHLTSPGIRVQVDRSSH